MTVKITETIQTTVLTEAIRMDNAKAQSTMNEKQARIAVRSAIILAAASFVISLYTLIATLPVKNLKDPAKLAVFFLPLAASGLALLCGWICWRARKSIGIFLLIGTLLIAIFTQTFIVSGLGVWLGISAIILSAAITSQTLPQKQSNRIIGLSVGIAIVTILVDLYYPLPRLSGGQTLQIFVGVVMGLVIASHILLMVQQFLDYTLRAKLIITFIFLSLAAVLILGISYSVATRNALTKATYNSLQIAAKQSASSIDGFYRNLISSLKTEADFPVLRNYLSANIRTGSIEEFNAYQLLNNFQQTTSALGYSVLSITGTVLLDTGRQNSTAIGFDVIPTNTYTSSLLTSGYYLSPVIFPNEGDPYLFAMARLDGSEEEFAGILMVRYPASILQDYIAVNNNLTGPSSYAILWDENKVRLAQGNSPGANFKAVTPLDEESIVKLQSTGRLPKLPSTELVLQNDSFNKGLERIAAGKETFTAVETDGAGDQDSDGELMIAAASKTTYQPWVVTFVQSQSTALAAITQQTRVTVVMAIAIVLAVSILGVFVAQMFTRPIIRLTKTAEKITGGDLNAQAVIGSQDEIGALASSFNLMTAQLRQTLAGLENRVEERTAELQHVSKQMEKRATQLQSVAQVAHAISAYKDPEQLLNQITNLISERFGFYHVGVFLLDKAGEYAVLQAANSEGGHRMLERGHRLKVGETSMVGHVSKQGKARLALDVGKDAVFFDNPDLPLTRSEISLPLLSGETVIGVLDVQNEQASAFTNEDIALLSTLADQVSIAIENARLFSDINQTVRELQSLQRQYMQQEWQRLTSEQLQTGYQYSFGKISPLQKEQASGRAESEDSAEKGLKIPISLRGQDIGSFNLEEIDNKRQWSEEEIALVKTIADQVGLALENARLLDVTQRRAARDRMIADITNKMRRAVDMDTLIQTAVREITNAINVPEAFVQLGVHPETANQIQPEPSPRQKADDASPEGEVVQ
jgi:GAF domain-containing protein/HAMP domain-containing protein